MVNRLMDLVVLVAELSQKSDKSLRDLDKELVHLGYSSEEIEHALFWMSSQWKPLGSVGGRGGTPAFRVLSPWEADGLTLEAHNYLLRLYGLGLIDEEQLEQVLARIEPGGQQRFDLSDMKVLAGDIMFDISGDAIAENIFEDLDGEGTD